MWEKAEYLVQVPLLIFNTYWEKVQDEYLIYIFYTFSIYLWTVVSILWIKKYTFGSIHVYSYMKNDCTFYLILL